jgi:hypothetical protein
VGEGAAAVDRPIFIVGPHRSGTTLVYRFLSRHADVGFYAAADRRLGSLPLLAHLAFRAGVAAYPHECQRIWDRFHAGEDDRADASGATPEVAAWHRPRAARTLALRGRARLLAKYPRLSLRLAWLDAVFPGCLFLHVTRDWRGTVNSTVQRRVRRAPAGEEGGWFGVRVPGWRGLDALPHPIAAARIYREVTLHLEREAERWGPRLRRVSYEGFCADPVGTCEGIAGWAGRPWTGDSRALVDRKLSPRNDKWKEGIGGSVDAIRAEDPAFYARCEA